MTKVLLLFSGGIDSTACIKYYSELGFNIRCVHIDYGQRPAHIERNRAIQIANLLRVEYEEVDCKGPFEFGEGEIRGRNAFLAMAALMCTDVGSGLLAMGIHGGTTYYDCGEEFAEVLSRMVCGYTGGRISFDAPFLNWDKKMIVEYSRERNLPLNLTYSCEAGKEAQCGKCPSCRTRRSLGVG